MKHSAKKRRSGFKRGLPIGLPSETAQPEYTDVERDSAFKIIYCLIKRMYSLDILNDKEYNRLLTLDLDHIHGQKRGRYDVRSVQLLNRAEHTKKTNAITKAEQHKDYRDEYEIIFWNFIGENLDKFKGGM